MHTSMYAKTASTDASGRGNGTNVVHEGRHPRGAGFGPSGGAQLVKAGGAEVGCRCTRWASPRSAHCRAPTDGAEHATGQLKRAVANWCAQTMSSAIEL
jgi:pantoate kinase